jgi:signal transduction histidine kinase
MRYSIQLKVLIYFSMIIFAGFSVLTYAAYHTTEQNTKGVIEEDMIEIKRNLDIALNQYLLINNMDLSATSIRTEGESISKQLTKQVGNPVDIYDSNGQKLSYITAPNAVVENSEDLVKAMKGEISFTTNFIGDKVIVSLSYPILPSKAGIIRYYKDYTELYTYNQKFKHMMGLFASLIFVCIFLTSYLLSRRFTRPIIRLAEASKEISNGNFQVEIDVSSQDEIGYLSANFNMMVHQLSEQITIIREDRDMLEDMQKQNKSFFDNVTHELKTPLTTITGYAQSIEDLGIKDDEFTRKGLRSIINESNRLNNMVIELIELSKATSKKVNYNFAEINVSALIQETCDEMMIKGKKYNITIDVHAPTNVYLRADKDRLKEVMINLIDNSIKYGNVNSTIHIHAYQRQSEIIIKVEDQGVGIPKESIEKVFDPFVRLSKKTSSELGSMGLGLAIVKEIVERHGGTTEIVSRLNQGTEVILRFGSEVV